VLTLKEGDVINMPLTSNDQITVLADILRNHSYDQCGTPAECAQIQRLSHALLQNQNLDQNLKAALQHIQHYGQTGAAHQQINEHIGANQSSIQQWVAAINQHS
jgi:hypothetical protein